jgi:hypothetical protein
MKCQKLFKFIMMALLSMVLLGCQPDLTVVSLTHSPEIPTTADTITFTAVVKNIGYRSAGRSTLGLKVGGETSPATYSVPSLNPGERHTVQRRENLSVAQRYRNKATADLNDDVTESNENNNQKTDDYQVMSDEDCISYNPLSLRIEDEGARGWLLTDGSSRMLMLDNQADARKALALAKRHTHQCFIGRNNQRPNRKDYIVEYWKGNSGIQTDLGQEDCIRYNPNALRIVNEGAQGWLLTDGSSRMLMLDNQADANKALALAKNYTHQCFIGRNNQRPDRQDYIVGYWKRTP